LPIASTAARFDYEAPAELFIARTRHKHGAVHFHRFDKAAEVIRFAIEELPPPVLMGTTLEVNEERYGGQQIQELYDSSAYTLTRPQSK
jgi:hypothetical protein